MGGIRLPGRLALAAGLFLSPGLAQAQEIGAIRAHLVYEETGRLSEDLVARPDFAAWNTIIGGGEAEEAANDLLVLVEVLGTGGEQTIAVPLVVVVRGENGRVIARRRFTGLFTSEQGRVWKALWLPDSTCAGRIEIDATIGRRGRRAQLNLGCGE
jgi:hypothetical protein